MRIRRMIPITCVSLVLVLGISGTLLAKSLTVRRFQIPSAVQFNSVLVQPGSYRLKISEGTGIAEMVLSQGDKVVAKALVEPRALQEAVKQTQLIVNPAKEGAPKVLQLRVVGDKYHYRIIQRNEGLDKGLVMGAPQHLRMSTL